MNQDLTEKISQLPTPDPRWYYYDEFLDLHRIKLLCETLIEEMSGYEDYSEIMNKKTFKVYEEIKEIVAPDIFA
jgi:hypothetical protein